MHVLTRSYILIYVLAVEVDAWFVPTAAELRGITTKIKEVILILPMVLSHSNTRPQYAPYYAPSLQALISTGFFQEYQN